MQLVNAAHVPIRADHIIQRDDDTVGSKGKGHITDRSFFSLFTGAELKSLDVSPYEGADIIHDMNDELPDAYRDTADFVFDGSCLDNIFDPARALRSMSKLLRVGGRIFCFNHSTLIQSAYLAFSPEWFWDFFEVNGFKNIRMFSCAFENVLGPWNVYPWLPGTAYPKRDFITVAIAEKTDETTTSVAPIQAHYRKMHGLQHG